LLLLRIARFNRTPFWREAASIDSSVTLLIMPGVILFGLLAATICLVEYLTPPTFSVAVDVTAYEIGGAILGMLLVLRTNEGLSRWWEARKLWGGIVNQCRNFSAAAIAYGPNDPAWRRAMVRWSIVFAHACRRSLRNERDLPEITALVGDRDAAKVAESDHMPGYVVMILARLLRRARDSDAMDPLAFLQIDKERMSLIDHIGGCERILKTPMPRAYSIAIRKFIFLFLALLPFGLIQKFDKNRMDPASHQVARSRLWLTPLVTMIVAFPLLSLDRIGSELQNPFSTTNLNHLPLDEITETIERNLLALLDGPAAEIEVVDLLFGLDSSEG
jgi:putative membrane protein